MAANDELPRGWTFAGTSASGGASLAAGVSPGVAHVLDSFSARVQSNAGVANWEATVVVNSSLGTYTNLPIGLLAAVGGVWGLITDSDDGLGLVTKPGESITVSYATGQAGNVLCQLTIKGHDI